MVGIRVNIPFLLFQPELMKNSSFISFLCLCWSLVSLLPSFSGLNPLSLNINPLSSKLDITLGKKIKKEPITTKNSSNYGVTGVTLSVQPSNKVACSKRSLRDFTSEGDAKGPELRSCKRTGPSPAQEFTWYLPIS